MALPRALEGARASGGGGGPWSLSFISFAVNPTLLTTRDLHYSCLFPTVSFTCGNKFLCDHHQCDTTVNIPRVFFICYIAKFPTFISNMKRGP